VHFLKFTQVVFYRAIGPIASVAVAGGRLQQATGIGGSPIARSLGQEVPGLARHDQIRRELLGLFAMR